MKCWPYLKIVVIPFLILITVNSFSQSKKDTVAFVSNYPVKKGYINLFKDNTGFYKDPATFVCIFSKDSNVFAVKNGRVKRIFKTDEFDSIIITSKDTTFLYANIDKFYKNAGDTIHKGDLIGTIKNDSSDNKYKLFFKIGKERKNVTYEDHIKFLQHLH